MMVKWRNSLWGRVGLILLMFLAFGGQAIASNGGAQFKSFGPFFDSSGVLYPSIKVYHYQSGTTTLQNCWSDEGKVSIVAQPFQGDLSGIATMYCDGDYKFLITDQDGNTLYTWDNVRVTEDTATMWEGNFGTSTPSAAAANMWQLFALTDGSNNYLGLYINEGASTSFVDATNYTHTGNLSWYSGTAYVGTLDHAISADRTWVFPDAAGNVVVDADTSSLTMAGSYTFSGNNSFGGTEDFTVTPTGSASCATNYVRTGPNTCSRSGSPSSISATDTTTCWGMTLPSSSSKFVLMKAIIGATQGTTTGIIEISVVFYSDSGCTTAINGGAGGMEQAGYNGGTAGSGNAFFTKQLTVLNVVGLSTLYFKRSDTIVTSCTNCVGQFVLYYPLMYWD